MEIIVAVGFFLLILCAFGLSRDLERINHTLIQMEVFPVQPLGVNWTVEVREIK